MYVDQQRAQWTSLCKNLTKSVEKACANATCDLEEIFQDRTREIYRREELTVILWRRTLPLEWTRRLMYSSLTFGCATCPAGALPHPVLHDIGSHSPGVKTRLV